MTDYMYLILGGAIGIIISIPITVLIHLIFYKLKRRKENGT